MNAVVKRKIPNTCRESNPRTAISSGFLLMAQLLRCLKISEQQAAEA
jgi:hypothetical protein